jgi:ribonucleotide monophosphatase NagD (HAD superfamily)
MGLQNGQVAMIGDDIITDIGGAHHAGMRSILVRTGKFREDTERSSTVKPTHTIDSITHLKDIL